MIVDSTTSYKQIITSNLKFKLGKHLRDTCKFHFIRQRTQTS